MKQIEKHITSNITTALLLLEKQSIHTLFGNINATDVTYNRIFWRIVKSFFTDKVTTHSKITLIEKKEVQKENKEKVIFYEMSETFIKLFCKYRSKFKSSTQRKLFKYYSVGNRKSSTKHNK